MDNIKQNKFTLEFKEKKLEQEYVHFHKITTLTHTRNAIILGLIMFYLFHFIDSQIVAGLNKQIKTNQTVMEKLLNDNMLIHNSLTSMVTNNIEKILRQNEQIKSNIENNIWKIRFNTLMLGMFIFGLSFLKRFKYSHEYFALLIGVIGGIAISIMISYVSGMASYIYLSGLMLIMAWIAIISRVRYKIAFIAIVLIIIFNNIITANQFIFNLLHQSKELGVGFLDGLMHGKLHIAINLPINNFILLSTMILVLFGAYIIEKYSRLNFIQNKENEELLLNILPKEIAEIKKKHKNKLIAKKHKEATILFCDIVNFTKFSSTHSPEEIVGLLNELYISFDELTVKYHIEKIKTIGDGYMLASGIPTKNKNHAINMIKMALAMLDTVKKFNKNHVNINFDIRIGINSGSVVAGVVGSKKFAYDVWGDTVNTASRMESGGIKSKIQISSTTYELIKDKCNCEKRKEIIEFKGKGKIQTYFVNNML